MAARSYGRACCKFTIFSVLASCCLLLTGCLSKPPLIDVKQEMTYVCRLLKVNPQSVPLPQVIWLDDSFEVTELFYSLTKRDIKVEGFYNPWDNTIILPILDFNNRLLWHELAHVVMAHNPRWRGVDQEGWAILVSGEF
jgi:hypothetical protein